MTASILHLTWNNKLHLQTKIHMLKNIDERTYELLAVDIRIFWLLDLAWVRYFEWQMFVTVSQKKKLSAKVASNPTKTEETVMYISSCHQLHRHHNTNFALFQNIQRQTNSLSQPRHSFEGFKTHETAFVTCADVSVYLKKSINWKYNRYINFFWSNHIQKYSFSQFFILDPRKRNHF